MRSMRRSAAWGRRSPRAISPASWRCGVGRAAVAPAAMYGGGGDEKVVGQASRERGGGVFVVSKFYPHHASRAKLVAACNGSLAQLGIEAIDLYVYHWRGPVPLEETVATLGELVRGGKIRRWGVSNFDTDDMEDLVAVPGGEA